MFARCFAPSLTRVVMCVVRICSSVCAPSLLHTPDDTTPSAVCIRISLYYSSLSLTCADDPIRAKALSWDRLKLAAGSVASGGSGALGKQKKKKKRGAAAASAASLLDDDDDGGKLGSRPGARLGDIKAYLAADSESDAEDDYDEQEGDDAAAAAQRKRQTMEQKRALLRAALLGEGEGDDDIRAPASDGGDDDDGTIESDDSDGAEAEEEAGAHPTSTSSAPARRTSAAGAKTSTSSDALEIRFHPSLGQELEQKRTLLLHRLPLALCHCRSIIALLLVIIFLGV